MPHLGRITTALLSLVVLTLLVDSTSAAAFKRVAHGQPAPAFTLPTADGGTVDLGEYRDGPLTIVAFWALWSPKSAPLLEEMQKLRDEFGDRGLRAVAVNAEGTNAPADLDSQVRALVDKLDLTFRVALDRDLEQYDRWGVIAVPATAFLGRDLEVVYDFSGHPTGAYEEMRQRVMEHLGIEEEVAEAAAPRRERYQADKRVTLNYGLAKTLYERGQASRASRKLEDVLEDDPKFPDAHALMGAIQLAEGDETKAREAFQKAVELDETVPLGLAGLAHFALGEGEVEKALELARKAVTYTEPEDLPPLPPPGGKTETPPAAPVPEPLAEGSARVPESPDQKAREIVREAQEEARETTARTGAQIGAGRGQAEPTAVAYLDRAAAAIAEARPEEARSLVGDVVDGLLDLPEDSGGKGGKNLMKKMQMMMKKRQSQE